MKVKYFSNVKKLLNTDEMFYDASMVDFQKHRLYQANQRIKERLYKPEFKNFSLRQHIILACDDMSGLDINVVYNINPNQ